MINQKTRTQNHRARQRAKGLVPKTYWVPIGQKYQKSLERSVKGQIARAQRDREAT